MSFEQVKEWFNKYHDDDSEFCNQGEFSKIPTKLSVFEDAHAMMVMSQVMDANEKGDDLINHYYDEKIWFSLTKEDIGRLNERQVRELSACNVYMDEDALCRCI